MDLHIAVSFQERHIPTEHIAKENANAIQIVILSIHILARIAEVERGKKKEIDTKGYPQSVLFTYASDVSSHT